MFRKKDRKPKPRPDQKPLSTDLPILSGNLRPDIMPPFRSSKGSDPLQVHDSHTLVIAIDFGKARHSILSLMSQEPLSRV